MEKQVQVVYIRHKFFEKLVLSVPYANKLSNHGLWLWDINKADESQKFELVSVDKDKKTYYIKSVLSGLYLTALPQKTGTYSEVKGLDGTDMPYVNVVLSEINDNLDQLWEIHHSPEGTEIISALSNKLLMPFSRFEKYIQNTDCQVSNADAIGVFEVGDIYGKELWNIEEVRENASKSVLDEKSALGFEYLKQGKFKEAHDSFEALRILNPDSSTCYSNIAKTYLTEANSIKTKDREANQRKIMLLEKALEYYFTTLSFIKSFQKISKLLLEEYAKGDFSQEKFLLSFLYTSFRKESFQTFMNIGQTYFKLEMLKESRNVYSLLYKYFQSRIQEKNKRLFEYEYSTVCKELAHIALISSVEDMSNYKKVLEYSQEAIRYDKYDCIKPHMMISKVYLTQGNYNKALKWINEALKISANNPFKLKGNPKDLKRKILMKKGEIYWKCKQFQDYIEIYKKLIELYPESTDKYEKCIQNANLKIESKSGTKNEKLL